MTLAMIIMIMMMIITIEKAWIKAQKKTLNLFLKT